MSDTREPKKSVSMGQIQATGNAPASAAEAKVVRKPQDINGNMGEDLFYNFHIILSGPRAVQQDWDNLAFQILLMFLQEVKLHTVCLRQQT